MNTCNQCSFWSKINNHHELNIGSCSKLSGKITIDDVTAPQSKSTGIGVIPCDTSNDIGFFYETKGWFGCIHHNHREYIQPKETNELKSEQNEEQGNN